jgi:undecaprenyl diphosphate synthase
MTGAKPPRRGPRHVALIMDGNGRWAEARGLPRTAGHAKGVEALREAVRAAPDFGIEVLTVYSFSSENWTRPFSEISFLLDLLRRFIEKDVDILHRSGVQIRMIGERSALDADLRAMIARAEALTARNSRLRLIVAFNYGSRQELTNAVRDIAAAVQAGEIAPQQISADLIAAHLETQGLPEPDLLIRTSGEQRLSNFLLWQCAYTELVFVEEHWPDFTRETFARAVAEYTGRERRFGGLAQKTA